MKLSRKKQEIFAVDAPLNDTTVYGTAKDGAGAIFSQDIGVLQGGLWKQGIRQSLLGNFAPFVEDSTSAFRVFSEQLAYLFQNGMAEWNAETNYYKDISFCQVGGQWYQSLTGTDLQPNIGNNPVGDIINWKKASFGGSGGFVLLNGYQFNMELTGDDALGWALSGSIVSGQNAIESLPVLTQAYNGGTDYGTGTIYSTVSGLKKANTLKKGILIAPYTTENVNVLNNLWNSGKEANVWLLDTVNARFMCPRTRNWTANTTGVNDFIPESLPNITGDPGEVVGYSGRTGTGAFKNRVNSGQAGLSSGNLVCGADIPFDASLSSPAYKDGAPVQQNASTVYVYYKIYDAIKPSDDIRIEDLTQILTDIQNLQNTKANVDGDNFTAQGKGVITGLGMPDYTKGGAITSGFIAPTDGNIIWYGDVVAKVAYINGINVGTIVGSNTFYASRNIDISKGETFTWTGIGGNAVFFPLKGV